VPRIRLRQGALDGLELHYTSAGDGPATLFIHGLGGFAESWRYTTAALIPHARVIAFDLPGFGQSAKPRGGYTFGFFVQVLDALLAVLEVERVRLVVTRSAGIATAFALAYPDRVERLALVSATVPGFPLRPSAVYRLMALPGFASCYRVSLRAGSASPRSSVASSCPTQRRSGSSWSTSTPRGRRAKAVPPIWRRFAG
jgi:pimeloyl-ACP methyl ester carboxylesterase